MNTPRPNLQRVIAAGFATTCVFLSTSLSNAQAFDPTIFDGSHTVVPGTINQRGDNGTGPSGDWQDDSLTVYGPDGQSQQPWGVETQMPGMPGMQGMQIPGMEGMQGQQGGMGGMGGMGGLPPLMGGGGGGEGQQQIPPGMEGMQGQSMEGESNGGQPPPGAKNTGEPPANAEPSNMASEAQGGEMPEGPSVDVPADMQIGDENQKIQQAQAQTPQDQGQMGEGENSSNEQGENQSSEDSSRPKSASGKQSGKRGAGSETGDSMPADL
jgi:hypothetical protein